MIGIFFVVRAIAAAETCRSIALQGGGSYGAYEAGVIWALANLSNPADITWNVVSGISVGAINAGAVVQFPMGQEVAMSNFLLNLWRSMNGSSTIYTEWKGGLIDGLLFQRGIYNTAPLVEFLRKNYLYGNQRNFSIGSTNLDTGLFSTFNESIGEAALNAVLCSASPPFFFPTQDFEGYTWADGGCVLGLDVFSAIERCLLITDESNVIVDLIYDNPYPGLGNETTFKTPEVFSRIFNIRSYDSSIWYTYNALVAYPKASFRHIIHPSEPMPGGIIPLNFTPSVIEYEIQMGINDTIASLKSPVTGREKIEALYHKSRASIIYP